MPQAHQSHPDVVRRLRRAHGHLATVIAMIEAGKPCLDVAQQLHAVRKAIENAQSAFVHDHIEHCLDDALTKRGSRRREVIQEFKTIARYV